MLSCFEPDIFRIKPDISTLKGTPPLSFPSTTFILISISSVPVKFLLLDRPHFLLWYKCLFINICFWASWGVGTSMDVRKKDVGAWSIGVVFILFFLSAMIGTKRAWQCLAWWKSVMAHWPNETFLHFQQDYDMSFKGLFGAALKVLGFSDWFDQT